MIKPMITKLSNEILKTLLVDDIIYAEFAGGGAMGNTGGVLLYLVKDEQMVCYHTSIFTDENTYLGVEQLLFKHQDTHKRGDIRTDKILFDFFYGGMGNYVFINKIVSLRIDDGYFIYNKNNKEYQIFSSIKVIFDRVVYSMKGSES